MFQLKYNCLLLREFLDQAKRKGDIKRLGSFYGRGCPIIGVNINLKVKFIQFKCSFQFFDYKLFLRIV